jgi:hypothetical protein
MGEGSDPRARKSWLGWSVLIGSVSFAAAGAWNWTTRAGPAEFNPVTGAVYGLLVGALFGVVADRVRPRG